MEPRLETTREGKRVRVLVADDSALCRDVLAELIGRQPELELAGTAKDGAEAVRAVRELRPDVVTMDLRMPVMDGLEATAAIMEDCPTPILVLTGHPFQAGRNMSFEAIRAGALDLMVKPDLGSAAERQCLAEDLARLLCFLATRPVAPRARRTDGRARVPLGRSPTVEVAAVVMAASAGGPGAVHAVLSSLPADFPAGLVLVQHLAQGFDEDFVDWLEGETALAVRLARQDDEVRPGQVLVAPSGVHLRLMPGGTCRLVSGAPIDGHRPSADVLFSSAARVFADQACGVILSGMGHDGVRGLAEIRERGGLTIAQDEGSCVVFGMPGSAVREGAVDAVLPLETIASALTRACALA